MGSEGWGGRVLLCLVFYSFEPKQSRLRTRLCPYTDQRTLPALRESERLRLKPKP